MGLMVVCHFGQCTLIYTVESFRQSCEKIQTVFIFVRYGEIQHMSKEQGVRLKAHTLFLGRVLYFPIPHSNEHRIQQFPSQQRNLYIN